MNNKDFKQYDVEVVRLVNTRQAGHYIKNGLKPIDLYWGHDALVFVFDKEKSKPFFALWRTRELA